jgi:hypothetical protein
MTHAREMLASSRGGVRTGAGVAAARVGTGLATARYKTWSVAFG